MQRHEHRHGTTVLGTFIDAVDWGTTVATIKGWAERRESRSVFLCNVHSTVTARDDSDLARSVADADLALPDGAPIAWVLRRRGFPQQTRIAGPDLMTRLCSELEGSGIGIFLFGSKETTLQKLEENLRSRFPRLDIRGLRSPKFGAWPEELEKEYTEEINRSGAGVIFVGLGCPRQEIWIANRKNAIRGVLIGVGAGFDFHAGTVSRAPVWVQSIGMEWCHRLITEPRRLWKRYLFTNSRFLALIVRDFVSHARIGSNDMRGNGFR